MASLLGVALKGANYYNQSYSGVHMSAHHADEFCVKLYVKLSLKTVNTCLHNKCDGPTLFSSYVTPLFLLLSVFVLTISKEQAE